MPAFDIIYYIYLIGMFSKELSRRFSESVNVVLNATSSQYLCRIEQQLTEGQLYGN